MIFDPKAIDLPCERPCDIREFQKQEQEESSITWVDLYIKWPFDRFLSFLNRYLPVYRIRNVLFTPENRGDLVRIRSLGCEYSDPREQLLHANFQILVDFIEKEKPFSHWAYEDDEGKKISDELLALYRWWTEDPWAQNPNGPEELWNLPDKELIEYSRMIYGDEMNWVMDVAADPRKSPMTFYVEAAAEVERNKMLARLIAIRVHLWT